MGAWGYKTFEDDTTCDWTFDLYDTDDPKAFLLSSLNPVECDDYLDYDACSSILGAAETVYSLLFNVRDNSPDDFTEWIENHRRLEVTDLKPKCIQALNRILSKKSELNELWSDNEEDYPNWKSNIKVMLNAFKEQ